MREPATQLQEFDVSDVQSARSSLDADPKPEPKSLEMFVKPLDEATYVTPRNHKDGAFKKPIIEEGVKPGQRIKGLAKFFDQFSDMLSA